MNLRVATFLMAMVCVGAALYLIWQLGRFYGVAETEAVYKHRVQQIERDIKIIENSCGIGAGYEQT